MFSDEIKMKVLLFDCKRIKQQRETSNNKMKKIKLARNENYLLMAAVNQLELCNNK